MTRRTVMLADSITGKVRPHELFTDTQHSTTPHTHDPGGLFRYPKLPDASVLAQQLHNWRATQSLAGCGWQFGSEIDGEPLCPCPRDAAAILATPIAPKEGHFEHMDGCVLGVMEQNAMTDTRKCWRCGGRWVTP